VEPQIANDQALDVLSCLKNMSLPVCWCLCIEDRIICNTTQCDVGMS
jgi:hypothetical protein